MHTPVPASHIGSEFTCCSPPNVRRRRQREGERERGREGERERGREGERERGREGERERGREGERERGREGEREKKKIKGFASGHTAMICCCSHAGGAKVGVSLHVAPRRMFAGAGSVRLGGGGDVVPRIGAVHRHTCIRGVRICERTA